MKTVRSLVSVVLLLLPVMVYAQAAGHSHDSQPQVEPGVAQKAFSIMKTLEGEWEGSVKTDMPIAKGMDDVAVHVTMRVTSRGNSIVHEFQQANTPLDPAKYDHPVTMLYVDGDQLNLVHYCDAGNRPRMTGKLSPDGKKVEFDFADISGNAKTGYMHNSAFTVIDENRHSENWTFQLPNGEVVHALFDLHRVK